MVKIFISIVIAWLPILVTAQGLNAEHVKAIEEKNLEQLMKLYDDDAVVMPEFHAPLYGKRAIETYYKNRFAHTFTNDYQRTKHDSKQVENYVIETGTFANQFAIGDTPAIPYTGNYIIVWKADKHNALHIVIEIWGSDKAVDRMKIELPTKLDFNHQTINRKKQDKVWQQLEARTSEIEQGVKKRDALALSKLYRADAIYIPYYSPMMVGAEKIKAYYIKHEDPAVTIDSVNIELLKVIRVGDIAISTAVYGVRWKAGESSGTVTGKNLNIWRKEKDGRYYLFRQMANHD